MVQIVAPACVPVQSNLSSLAVTHVAVQASFSTLPPSSTFPCRTSDTLLSLIHLPEWSCTSPVSATSNMCASPAARSHAIRKVPSEGGMPAALKLPLHSVPQPEETFWHSIL